MKQFGGRKPRLVCIAMAAAIVLSAASVPAAEKTIRVGVYEFSPISSMERAKSEKGKGIFVDLLDYIAGKESWRIDYVAGSITECMQMLQEGKIDLVIAAPYSEEAAKGVHFSSETVISTWAQTFTKNELRLQSLLDMDGKAVGLVFDEPYNAAFRSTVRKLNISCNIVEFPNPDAVLEGIKKNWVDVGIIDRFHAINSIDPGITGTPVLFSPIELRFAVPIGMNDDILTALDYYIAELKATPDSIYYNVLNHYIGKNKGNSRFFKALIWSLIGTLGLLLVLGSQSILLRYQVKRQTRELSERNHELEKATFMLSQSEHDLSLRNRELEEASERLRQSQKDIVQKERMSALGLMASGIAHDFNNVLMPILGLIDLVIDYPDEYMQDKNELLSILKHVREASEDARQIVKRLRLINKPGDDGMVPLDLAEIVESCVRLTQPRWKEEARANGHRIQVKIDIGSMRMSIVGNASELREAIMNILLNAIDAMPEGGIISVAGTREPVHAVIKISDTGIGMSPGTLERCREAFYTTKGVRGTGLGLAIVAGIIERHSGILEIKSQEGAGTCISILLPLSDARQGVSEQPKAPPVSFMKILVVDDDPRSLEIHTLLLKKDGHEVTVFQSGTEAIELINGSAENFDLIISDRAMPDVNGDKVLAAAKKKCPSVSTLLVTGFGDIMNDVGELPEGVDKVLSKPVTLNDLRSVLGSMMKDKSARPILAQT